MRTKKIIAVLISMMLLFGTSFTGHASVSDSAENVSITDSNNSYSQYDLLYQNAIRPNAQIEVLGADAVSSNEAVVEIGDYDNVNDCLIWKNGKGNISFNVNVSEAGRYVVGLNYYSVTGTGSSLEYAFMIDGEYPFDDCANISFPRYYKYSVDEFLKDTNDNELRPEQVDYPMWCFANIIDNDGIYTNPYEFYFSEGNHTLTFSALRDGIVISSVILYNPEKTPSYKEYKSSCNADDLTGEPIVIEAEKPLLKSLPVLYPSADRSDPATSKSNPVKTRYNTIGGEKWAYRNQQIIWEFEVLETGFYKIGFRYKQNYLRGMSTYREIMIDGKVPFDEFSSIEFHYSSSWELHSEEKFEIFLEKGKHTITLTPTLQEFSDIISRTLNCISQLNESYLQIVAITGTSPDMWRNYNLHEAVPNLKETLKSVYDELLSISEDIYELTGTRGSEASLIDRINKQLKKFQKSQDAISEQLESFHSNISSLSSWVLKLQTQSLLLDQIYVVPSKSEFPNVKATLFEKISFNIKSFIGAFTEDYSSIGNIYSGESDTNITVWTSSGRDQADITKELIDSEFTSKSGIKVNLQLVQGSLESAVLAGRGPDVSIGGVSPITLALRDAVVPLDEFIDFNDYIKKYPSTLLVPFSIKSHTYALPESINFNMMFYRTDIFKRLNISPPKTWEQFYSVLEILQRNNMNVGLPETLFQILVLQMGGRIFNKSLTSTELDSNIANKAFVMFTDFFSQYGVPIVKDDYNRFRNGELPLTIIPYDFYFKLYSSAPEIRNQWSMTSIPGFTEDENINIITETCCCILKKTKNKDAAWEFIKWWTSSEIQDKYAKKLESIFGIAGRFSPADQIAYSKVAWSAEELDVLLSQFSKAIALPTVAGNYYVARNITNAYESVLYNNKNPREALKYWMNQTNQEIKRRSEEFGVGKGNTFYE